MIEADGILHLFWVKHHVEPLLIAVDHGTWNMVISVPLLINITCIQLFHMLSAVNSGVLVRLRLAESSRYMLELPQLGFHRDLEDDIRAVPGVGQGFDPESPQDISD